MPSQEGAICPPFVLPWFCGLGWRSHLPKLRGSILEDLEMQLFNFLLECVWIVPDPVQQI